MKRVIIAALCCMAVNTALLAQTEILIAGSGWNKVGLVDVESSKLK